MTNRLATTLLLAAVTLPLSIPAFAQTATGPAEIVPPGPARMTAPGTSDVPVVNPGGSENSGPGSVGTEAHSGLGADSRTNNSAASGNANKPEVAIPNTGGGGGR